VTRYAIGDVHGCVDALDALLAALRLTPSDRVVFLGDLIDRGPQPVAVVERVMNLTNAGVAMLVIGNHEEMMLRARDGALDIPTWAACGGAPTLVDYERNGRSTFEAHCAFFETSGLRAFEDETHLYVHGTVDPLLSLDDTPGETLRWRRFGPPAPHISGKRVVAGHTPQKKGWPLLLPHAACIDTWCCGGQWLTALDLDGDRFVQAHEDGSVRAFTVDGNRQS
jgi:serine/threonine protein phosphatase 1